MPQGVIFTRDDRAGEGKLSSRLGLVTEAVVFAFGITTDFRTKLFPGLQRLIELADRLEQLQVEALCWCGARATHNARTVGGEMVVEGAQVVVGDVNRPAEKIGYEVLCRLHHRRRMTSAVLPVPCWDYPRW